jgi:hypothetical protein
MTWSLVLRLVLFLQLLSTCPFLSALSVLPMGGLYGECAVSDSFCSQRRLNPPSQVPREQTHLFILHAAGHRAALLHPPDFLPGRDGRGPGEEGKEGARGEGGEEENPHPATTQSL